jgi:branched-chain amino acid aminotransferase
MGNAMCWFNGELMPVGEARIPVLDHGLLYGDGVFEGIRFYHGRAFRLSQHLNRLYRSASAIRLTIPQDDATLAAAVRDTISAFGLPAGYLRLVVTRGVGKLGIDPTSCTQPNVFVIADELSMTSQRMRSEGARVIVAATRRISSDALDPRIKSLNYLNHILARMEATHAGADEAILLNARGHVAEGTADNVFVVRDGTLLTPPVSDGALEGITRAVILELADENGLPWAERSLGTYDLHAAEECFLTGTGAELVPVCKVDGWSLGECPGPVFLQLQAAFRELVEQEAEPGREPECNTSSA